VKRVEEKRGMVKFFYPHAPLCVFQMKLYLIITKKRERGEETTNMKAKA
jgi:hypothetical protein